MSESSENEETETFGEIVKRVCEEENVDMESVVRKFIQGVFNLRNTIDATSNKAGELPSPQAGLPCMPPVNAVDAMGNTIQYPYLALFPNMQEIMPL